MILYQNKTYWVQSHYKKAVHLPLNLQQHLGSPRLFGGFRVAHLFIFLCHCICFWVFFVSLCSMSCAVWWRVSGLIILYLLNEDFLQSMAMINFLSWFSILNPPLVLPNFLYILYKRGMESVIFVNIMQHHYTIMAFW